MKALRISLYVLTGVIVILIVAAVILVRSFDLNDYKDEITAYVQDRTGRTLVIDDNIEFSLFPWFAVETGGVSLSDDPEFGERDFISIDTLSARVRVWPLLRRRIEIGRVVLDGIDLNLGISAEGEGNWSSLTQTSASEPSAVDTADVQRPALQDFQVEGISLRNARILWHDANGDVTYIVRDMNLNTGPVDNDAPVELSVALSLLDVGSQASVEIELETVMAVRPVLELRAIEANLQLLDPRQQQRAAASVEMNTLSIEDRTLSTSPAAIVASLRDPPVGPDQLDIELNFASVELDLDSEELIVNGFSARTGTINAGLNVRGDAILSEPRLSGTIDLRSATISGLFDSLGIDSPLDSNAQGTGAFVADAEFGLALSSGALEVNRFSVAALGAQANGQATLSNGENLSAELRVPAFRPTAALLGVIAPHIPDGVDLSTIASASVAANFSYAANTGNIQIPTYAIDLDSGRFEGQLSIDNARSPTLIGGELLATGLDNRLLAALFGPWLPAELIEAELGTFRLATDFEYETESQIADFAPLQLTAYGLTAEGQLSINTGSNPLALSGRAALASFSPRALLQRFELPVPATADPNVFRSAELAASFETDGAHGEFRDIAVTLDDSRITGEFRVENFADPEYRFVLRADRIDADRYLPPAAPAAEPPAGEAAEKRLGDLRLASEPLTATNVSGTASVGNLRIGGMDFEQLNTEVAFGGGRAALTSVQTRLYGGNFDGGLAIDATAETSVVRLRGNANQVAIRPLLEAMLGGAHISGTGTVALDLTGRGNTINEALQTAAGSLNLELRDGTIEGMNLGRKLCEAVNSGRNLPAPAAAPRVTNFSVIRGTSVVSEGNASSSDLFASTSFVNLTGRGGIRLVDQWIDNQYRAQLTGPVQIAGCESLNRTIASNPIPVNFTLKGRLPDIEVGVDINQLLQDWARREIRQRAEEEVRDAIIDRLFN